MENTVRWIRGTGPNSRCGSCEGFACQCSKKVIFFEKWLLEGRVQADADDCTEQGEEGLVDLPATFTKYLLQCPIVTVSTHAKVPTIHCEHDLVEYMSSQMVSGGNITFPLFVFTRRLHGSYEVPNSTDDWKCLFLPLTPSHFLLCMIELASKYCHRTCSMAPLSLSLSLSGSLHAPSWALIIHGNSLGILTP